jgi:hypothetical protein
LRKKQVKIGICKSKFHLIKRHLKKAKKLGLKDNIPGFETYTCVAESEAEV